MPRKATAKAGNKGIKPDPKSFQRARNVILNYQEKPPQAKPKRKPPVFLEKLRTSNALHKAAMPKLERTTFCTSKQPSKQPGLKQLSGTISVKVQRTSSAIRGAIAYGAGKLTLAKLTADRPELPDGQFYWWIHHKQPSGKVYPTAHLFTATALKAPALARQAFPQLAGKMQLVPLDAGPGFAIQHGPAIPKPTGPASPVPKHLTTSPVISRFITATPSLHHLQKKARAPIIDHGREKTRLWLIIDFICREYIPVFLQLLPGCTSQALALSNAQQFTDITSFGDSEVLEKIITASFTAREQALKLRPHSTEEEWDAYRCNATTFTKHFGLDGLPQAAQGLELSGPLKSIVSTVWEAAWTISRTVIKQSDELSSEDDNFAELAHTLEELINTLAKQ